MMKKWKRKTAIFLVITMVLVMNCTAFAAEMPQTDGRTEVVVQSDDLQNKTTAPEDKISEHTFKAYQMFSGTKTEASKLELRAIHWGDGIDREKFVNELKKLDAFKDGVPDYNSKKPDESADAIARIISNWEENSDTAKTFAKIAEECLSGTGHSEGTAIPAGYYLVVDVTIFPTDAIGVAKNPPVLLMMAEETKFLPDKKYTVPGLTKEVKEIDDSAIADSTKENWQHTADYDIGDQVEFKLTGTLPSNYADYQSYKYEFHDTLGVGMEFLADTVEVKLVNEKAGEQLPVNAGYEVKPVVNGTTQGFQIIFENLKNATDFPQFSSITADTKIVVEYKAKLLNTAIVGNPGNPNSAYVKYSNNPNLDGEGEMGTTPEDKVVVFTYQLIINKVKPNEEGTTPLEGAGFSLFKLKAGEQYEPVHVAVNENGEYVVLQDLAGHTHAASTQPEDSDTQNSQTDNVEDNQNENAGSNDNIEVSGEEKRGEPQAQADSAKGSQLKPQKPIQTNNYCEIGGKNSKITTFTFKGLDAGQYVLVETTVPEGGYNRIDDLYFTIEAITNGGEDKLTLTELKITDVYDAYGRKEVIQGTSSGTDGDTKTPVFAFTAVFSNGSLTTDILNMTGTLLPATGGIGTTIFYVLGGILVVGAAVLLIIRKRTKKEE